MPVNLPNFLQADTQRSPFEGLLESAIEGYKASRLPKQLRQEEEQRDLANRLLGHQGRNFEIQNEYLPRKSEADIGNTEQQTRLYGSQTRGHDIANLLEETYGAEREKQNINEILANIGLHNEQTRGARINNQTLGEANQLDLQGKRADIEGKRADIQKAFEEIAAKRRENEHPAYKYGNDAAKLWEISQDYRRKGDEESAKVYENLATTALQEQLNKNKPKEGKTPEDVRMEENAKIEANQYGKTNDRLTASSQLLATAEGLKSMLSHPSFSNAVGPVDNWLGDIVGFPSTREFAKEFENSIGQAKLDMISAFKGSTSDKELKFVENIAATRGNTESAVRGYVNSIYNMAKIANDRNQYMADQQGNGISYRVALANAQKKYPILTKTQLKKPSGALSGTDKDGVYHDNIDPSNKAAFLQAGGKIDE